MEIIRKIQNYNESKVQAENRMVILAENKEFTEEVTFELAVNCTKQSQRIWRGFYPEEAPSSKAKDFLKY